MLRSCDHSLLQNWCRYGFYGDRRVLLNNGIESVDGISVVRNGSTATVRFHQAVATLDNISVASFLLGFVVALNFERKLGLLKEIVSLCVCDYRTPCQ